MTAPPDSNTAVDPPIDQARYLPESIGVIIHNAHNLQGQKDALVWTRRVENALQQNDLQDLIDSSIPRPSKESPKYALWRKYSKLVKGWLFTTLSDHIVKELRYSKTTYEYADEFYKAILTTATGGIRDLDDRACSIKRENYRTVAEFIDDYCEVWELLEKINSRLRPPYREIMIVLEQVYHDMPSLCENYFCKDISDATASDFIFLCGKIKTLAPDRKKNGTLGKKNIKASTQTCWLNLENPSEKPTEKDVTKRNEPPQEVNAEEWVKNWVESPSQKTKSGKCVFCKFPGHGAADCYYLNLSNRPNGWKPRRALWCYQP